MYRGATAEDVLFLARQRPRIPGLPCFPPLVGLAGRRKEVQLPPPLFVGDFFRLLFRGPLVGVRVFPGDALHHLLLAPPVELVAFVPIRFRLVVARAPMTGVLRAKNTRSSHVKTGIISSEHTPWHVLS